MDETKEWICSFVSTFVPKHSLLANVFCFCLLTRVFYFLTNLIFGFAYNCLFSFQSSSEVFHTSFSAHQPKPASFVPTNHRDFGGQSRSDGEAKYTYRYLYVKAHAEKYPRSHLECRTSKERP